MKIRQHKENRFAASAVLLLCLTFAVVGQPLQKRGISGTVSDENGGKIRGAKVILLSRAGLQLISTTDSSGSFRFTGLNEGDYFLEVKAEGFSTVTSELITVDTDGYTNLDITLKVASVKESVVITATGTPQRADDVAKVVTALDSEQIEAKHLLSLTDTLRGTPAVRIQNQGSPGALSTVRIRGQRPYDTALLLEGLRVRDASDINGSAVPLFTDLAPIAIDRVEILRGSGSSIYGTNAIGGVINLVPTAGAGEFHSEAGFEGGSLHSFRERLKGSGGINRFGYSFGLGRTDVRKGIDGQDEFGNSVGGGRVQFNPTNNIMIAGNFFGAIANARLNDSPFALAPAFGSNDRFPRAVAGVTFQPDFNNPDQGRRNQLLVGAARLTHQVNGAISYGFAYQRVSAKRRNYNGANIDPAFQSFYPFGDFEFINVNHGVTDTFNARVNAQLGRKNLVTAGFEFERESFFQESIPSFSAFNNTTDRQRTFALFAQDQMSLVDDRLQISLAVRGQAFRLDAADRPGMLGGLDVKSSLTGDGAVAYFIPATNTKLRIHAGNGLRVPALFERFGAGTFAGMGLTRFGDPTLRAEQSISVDGGVDQRLANDKLLIGATYFYTRLQRTIAFRSFSIDPLGLGRFSGYVNEPGGLSRGVETYVESRPARGSDMRINYTYTNSDRATSSGLLREYVIPRHLFGFTWSQRLKSVVLHLDVNHTGEYLAPVFESNFPFRMAELSFDGYTKADMFVTYERRVSERLTLVLFGGAENFLDRKYYENGFRAPGFIGRGGVNLRF
jgi:iron complex outermembrane receptor protein